MGKNITIYFTDEVCELIERLEGKGTLINELIVEHFSNDEDVLKRKLERLDRETSVLKAKLDKKISERLKREEAKQSQQPKTEVLPVRERQRQNFLKNIDLVEKFGTFEKYEEEKIKEVKAWWIK